MVTFRLCYDNWVRNPERNQEEGPLFHVFAGATEPLLTIQFLMGSFEFRNLQDEIALQQDTRFPNASLRAAVVRFAVAQITQGLKDGRLLAHPTDTTFPWPVDAAYFPTIRQLLQEKTCDYQVRQGRDLLCSVASADDPTRRGQTGLQTFAPTSRVICQNCDLPDTDYVCSHLIHPEVERVVGMGMPQRRQLLNVLCDLGKAEIVNPAECRAGGHACWERLIEQELDRPVIPLSPLAVPEAFDYLDVCWRLAFGRKQTLVRVKNLTGVAVLSLPCATRDELIARLSALVDVLNSLTIPDGLLPEPSKGRSGTLNRLQACLKECLDAAEYPACERAITLLRAVVDLRDFFQHGATGRDLPKVCAQLSLPFPLPAWGETWERIRVTVTEALGVLREAIRRYADAGTGAPL